MLRLTGGLILTWSAGFLLFAALALQPCAGHLGRDLGGHGRRTGRRRSSALRPRPQVPAQGGGQGGGQNVAAVDHLHPGLRSVNCTTLVLPVSKAASQYAR